MFLALGLAVPATAATINSVSAINGGGGSAGCGTAPSQSITQSPNTETVSVNDGAINCTLYVEATAGGGLVGARGTLNGTGTSQAASGASHPSIRLPTSGLPSSPMWFIRYPIHRASFANPRSRNGS